jgi:effector-binding domain-containing protein
MIELIDQAAQPVLMIRDKTSLEMLPKIIGESYMKIMAYLNELGESPADVPYTAYYNLDMQNLEVEIGFPVSKILPEKEEIKAGEIAQGKVVSMMYKGPYPEMAQSYNDIFKWIAENGFESSAVYYEYYYNSPNEVSESELLTKIVIPLKENKVTI